MAGGGGVRRATCFGWLLATGGAISVALSLVNTALPISWHFAYYIGRMLSSVCFLCAGLVLSMQHGKRDVDGIAARATFLHGGIGVILFLYAAFDNALVFTIDEPRAALVLATYGALLVAGASMARSRGLHPTSWPGSLLVSYAAYKLVEEACRDAGLIALLVDLAGGGNAWVVMILGVLYFVPIVLNGGVMAAGVAIVKHGNRSGET
ncbi:MAG: hypothetical protein GYA24_22400 [Candidatus Lokiarchaeota archaeon]|nr:hypothetical protein [Candidatus Lokiarchaeota archaeon]